MLSSLDLLSCHLQLLYVPPAVGGLAFAAETQQELKRWREDVKQDVKEELAAALKKMKMAEGPSIRGCGIGPTAVTRTDLLSHLRFVCVLRLCSNPSLFQ